MFCKFSKDDFFVESRISATHNFRGEILVNVEDSQYFYCHYFCIWFERICERGHLAPIRISDKAHSKMHKYVEIRVPEVLTFSGSF